MPLNKTVLIAIGAAAAALLALLLIPSRDKPGGDAERAGGTAAVARPAGSTPPGPARQVKASRSATRLAPPSRKEPGTTPPPAGVKQFGPKLAAIPEAHKPFARVNGVDLTPDKVFPPGVMNAGDEMPDVALEKFVEDAVKRALVVQEAEKRGFATDPEFAKLVEDLRGDVESLPNLSAEEKAWQLAELRDQALMDRLLLEEGIVPRRLEPGEAQAYYQAHSAEYDWVRKREALKGTPEDKIERRVMDEVRKDLMIPIRQEYTARREAFTAELREGAEVEILDGEGSGR